MCKMLLPPTFEVDHIVELCDGGKDEYSNLQALCPNCHALKTRANILRRDKAFKKEFGKRFDLMQTNSFKEFEYKPKQSKYFSQGKYPQSIIILNYIDIYGFKNEYIYI